MSKKKSKKTSPVSIILPIIVVILLVAIAIASFYLKKEPISYDVNTSTVFFMEEGKIVSTDIEAFDTGKYSADELSAYLTEFIDTYNMENGDGCVTQLNFLVENDVAKLTLEYANTGVYKDFYGIELYSGTVSEALEAGYTFDVDFARVSNETVESCSAGEITQQTELKVAIIKANTNVVVDGEILYISADNIYEYGTNHVVIKENYNIFELGVEEESETATETVTETTEESTDIFMEDGAPVGSTPTESTEIIFDFGDEETEDVVVENTKTEVSQTYIYIIYE